jgi:hypothetical protein
MGTINKQTNKIKKKADESKKIIQSVKQEEKEPKEQKRRNFRPPLILNPNFAGCNPFYSPKRKKK